MTTFYNKLSNISTEEQLIMANNKIYIDTIDPLDLLDRKPLSLDTLLEKYTILRNKNHPDKGGEKINFINFNNAIQKIKFIMKSMKSDRQYDSLRNSFYDSIQNETNNKLNFDFYKNDEFNIKRFNQIFEKHKFKEEDYGYDSIMNTPEYKDIPKIDPKNFHQEFSKIKNKKTKKIIEYKIPEAINENDYHLLGESQNINHSRYSDYQQVFDESNLVNDDISIKNKSLKDIQEERDKPLSEINNMSDNEKNWYELEQKKINQLENNRLNKLKDYDSSLKEYSNKINNIFLHN